MLAIQYAMCPTIIGPGLNVSVYQALVLVNGGEVSVPTTVIGLAANTTTYGFLNIGTGTLQTNTTGFPANVYPIFTVTTTNTGVGTLIDNRPDYVVTGSNSGITGRFILNNGTLLTTGNFALTGWGSGASITSLAGRDSAHSFTITAGAGASEGPQISLTFANGAWAGAPLVFTSLTKGTGMAIPVTYTSTTTTYTITMGGLPISGLTYSFSVLCCGIQ